MHRTTDTAREPRTPGPLIHVETLARRTGVRHAFTTRAPLEGEGVLELARRPGVEDEALRRGWESVARALAPELGAERVALLHQVHGAEVVEVTMPGGPLAPVAEADAAWTGEAGLILAVRTADCVPVLIAGRELVGVAHAGWRGVAGRVVPALIDALRRAGERPEDLAAAIGPAISGEVYEVGDEVVDGLRRAGLDDADFLVAGRAGRPHVDLIRAVAVQLGAAGLERRAIASAGICTYSDPRLHSHRRDAARSGRQAGVVTRVP